jgi:hypothetical protein
MFALWRLFVELRGNGLLEATLHARGVIQTSKLFEQPYSIPANRLRSKLLLNTGPVKICDQRAGAKPRKTVFVTLHLIIMNLKKLTRIIRDLTIFVKSLTDLAKACRDLLIAVFGLVAVVFMILSIKP